MIGIRIPLGTGEWMLFAIRSLALPLAVGLVLLTLPSMSTAQEAGSGSLQAADRELPAAPEPQFAIAAADESDEAQAPSAQNQNTQQPSSSSIPAAAPSPDGTSQSTPAQPTDEKSQRERAEEQLKQQEHQRVAGVMASFNTTTNRNALPLSPGQKFELFFKSETDPWPFVLSGIVAGFNQASNAEPQWGQGAQGYAKRFGASYSDSFIGNFFGNAVLTSVLHEDPRYFQKGTGSKLSRFLWAATSTVWCKRDKGGWGPNYANVGGNMIGAAIARAYYPASERTVNDTISDGLTVSAEGIVGSEIIEFWPDLARHYKRKQAEKLARQEAQHDAQGTPHPAPQPTPAAKPQNPQN
jgi:hypothetical protein